MTILPSAALEVRRKRFESVPVSMMCAQSVMRSSSALRSRDFVLRSLLYTEPRFIPDALLTYRYHDSNAVWNLADRHLTEGRQALARYFTCSNY